MKIFQITMLSLLLLSASACGNRKKNKDIKEPKVEQSAAFTTERGTTMEVAIADMNDKIKSDPYQLIDAHVDYDNKLHLTIEYSGGCKDHKFKLLGSKAILKSLPAQRPLMIVHNANEDECRSIIREEFLVDISEFAYTKEQGSVIILLLDGQRLEYTYQVPGANDK